ncbi:hypothetical protein [Flocculibacter collagenilyticus]|uniref:hypothetical protein n=1 Tax=Flocculibacter collagenilyticus TaxID=2744479 RepID=UPI0018F6E189|nr:hypothetical protein [Flocculibacter collagenilyticus]
MKLLMLFGSILVSACASTTSSTVAQSEYIPPAKRQLVDPDFKNGKLYMKREDWFHNFKVGAIPDFCSNPNAGFLASYQGIPSDCEKTVEQYMDYCVDKVINKKLPQVFTSVPQATIAGENVGLCTFSAYRASLKKANS